MSILEKFNEQIARDHEKASVVGRLSDNQLALHYCRTLSGLIDDSTCQDGEHDYVFLFNASNPEQEGMPCGIHQCSRCKAIVLGGAK